MSLRLVYRMQRSIRLGALGMSITPCNVAKTNEVTNVQFLIQDKIKELDKVQNHCEVKDKNNKYCCNQS